MMGCEPPDQDNLFSYDVALERRVRADHPLRRIKRAVDFSFIYDEVKDTYGTRGNVSVPPAVILKLMLLLIMYNVRSERELMETLPERLDWLWFLGYNLDTPIPDHSVLSKARSRWGEDTFRAFFEGIYPDDRFIYNKETDTLTCPAGKELVKRTFHQQRNTTEYAAPKRVCRTCELKDECTRNKTGGRSVQRHARKEYLDEMLINTQSPSAKQDIKTRQHLMERSFARSVRYSFDSARRRGAVGLHTLNSERGKHNRAWDDGGLPTLPGLYRRENHAADVRPMNACTELPGCTVLRDRFGQQAVKS